MLWNLSEKYNELEVIAWVLCEAILRVCAPLERLLVCIWMAGMLIVQWIGLARIWQSYEAYCCHQLTCCSIRETR